MRYRIESNIFGKGSEDCKPQVVYTDDRNDAEVMFHFLLDNGVRPVRLIDEDGEHYTMKAENGIRTGC